MADSCRTWRTCVLEAGVAHAMKCSLCHYVSPPDGPTHNARTCPLRQTQCRRTLPEGHQFYEAGQCVSANCVHKQLCNTCGVPGHLYGTQALNTRRWKFNSKGALVRKQTKRALCKADFVCTLMTDVSIRSMVDNSRSVSTAAAHDAHARRVSTSRVRGNSNAQRLGVDETVRIMEEMKSDAALLQPKNKVHFKTLYKNAHHGAVAASRLAASAAESSLDEETPPLSDGEEDDKGEESSETDARQKSGPGSGKNLGGNLGLSDDEFIVESKAKRKDNVGREFGGGGGGSAHEALRVPRGGQQSRADRYAAAVAKGQRRSRAGKQNTMGSASTSGSRREKGKGIVQNAVAIDVDAEEDADNGRGWPLGTRTRFEVTLPAFFSPRFGCTPPIMIAHAVAAQLYQCKLEDVETELTGMIVKGAVETQVRGYMLNSGTMSSAQVAEWLCAAMTNALRSATLPSMANAVQQVVQHEAASAAKASGVGTPTAVAGAAGSGACAASLPLDLGVQRAPPSSP